MIHSKFGDLEISQLAMGSMRLPRTGDDDADIDVAQSKEMVAAAFDGGINYFDTAWGYHGGNSELVMGELLSDYDRDCFYLATKFPGYDSENWDKVEEIFNKQLEKCKVDYFDFYLIHNVCEMNIDAYLDDEKYGIVTYLRKMRDEGKIKHLGFSVHAQKKDFDRFLDKYGEYMEFCQIQLNWFDWNFQDAKYKVNRLNELGIPIWVMEPLRGGKLASVPKELMAPLEKLRPGVSAVEWSMRFLQSIPGVTTILSGASDLTQMKDNLRIFSTSEPLTSAEMAALLEVGSKLSDNSVPCTACNYCASYCPQELPISHLIFLYNQRIFTGQGDFIVPMALGVLGEDKQPSACIGCRSCEAVCPQSIPIADVMSDFAKLLDEQ